VLRDTAVTAQLTGSTHIGVLAGELCDPRQVGPGHTIVKHRRGHYRHRGYQGHQVSLHGRQELQVDLTEGNDGVDGQQSYWQRMLRLFAWADAGAWS
jgi:hypothetical protein